MLNSLLSEIVRCLREKEDAKGCICQTLFDVRYNRVIYKLHTNYPIECKSEATVFLFLPFVLYFSSWEHSSLHFALWSGDTRVGSWGHCILFVLHQDITFGRMLISFLLFLCFLCLCSMSLQFSWFDILSHFFLFPPPVFSYPLLYSPSVSLLSCVSSVILTSGSLPWKVTSLIYFLFLLFGESLEAVELLSGSFYSVRVLDLLLSSVLSVPVVRSFLCLSCILHKNVFLFALQNVPRFQ